MESQKHLFNLSEDVSYLNCAYMSPQLKAQTEMGMKMMHIMENPYQLSGDDFFQPVARLKATFSKLINNPEPDRIALIPSVSYGLANAAKNVKLKPGQEILLIAEQFPSNVYIWQRIAEAQGAKVRFVDAPEQKERSAYWNASILDAINEQTAMVALGNVHWADGTFFDLEKIRTKSSEVGALLVIDGTQSVGALPFDVQKIQPDALICAGYKWLLGPYGTGLAYYGPAFDNGEAIEENWINRLDSEDFKNLVNYQEEYKPMAHRYSVGQQSNFLLVALLQIALDQLLIWQPENIQSYCESLFAPYIDQFYEMGCSMEDKAARCHHLFGIRLGENLDAEQLTAAFKKNGVFVSFRGSSIRVAPHLFNEEKDVKTILQCFESAMKKQYF
jgi:selenocysteine lyase/cysteine desulfurase